MRPQGGDRRSPPRERDLADTTAGAVRRCQPNRDSIHSPGDRVEVRISSRVSANPSSWALTRPCCSFSGRTLVTTSPSRLTPSSRMSLAATALAAVGEVVIADGLHAVRELRGGHGRCARVRALPSRIGQGVTAEVALGDPAVVTAPLNEEGVTAAVDPDVGDPRPPQLGDDLGEVVQAAFGAGVRERGFAQQVGGVAAGVGEVRGEPLVDLRRVQVALARVAHAMLADGLLSSEHRLSRVARCLHSPSAERSEWRRSSSAAGSSPRGSSAVGEVTSASWPPSAGSDECTRAGWSCCVMTSTFPWHRAWWNAVRGW